MGIDSTMDEIRKDFEKDPLLSGLVKRSAASDPCSFFAGCAPGTQPAEIHHDCKCLTPEQLQNVNNAVNCGAAIGGCASGTHPASVNDVCKCLTPEQLKNVMDSAMDEIRKDFQKNPSLSGLVKRSASASECSAESARCAPGTEPASINNVCKCLTPEQLQKFTDSALDEVKKDLPEWMHGYLP